MINVRNRVARRNEWLTQNRLMSALENAMERQVAAELRKVAREAAAEFLEDGDPNHAMAVHYVGLEQTFRRNYRRAFAVFGARAIAAILGHKGVTADLEVKAKQDALQARTAEFVNKWAPKRALAVSKSTERRINREIAKGVEEGLSENDVAKKIAKAVGGVPRARTIARTEMHAASQDAAMEAVKEMGINVTKEWIATNDDRTRPDHAEADGQDRKMSEPFDVGGEKLDFPGDPSGDESQTINCRCVVVFNEE